MLSYSTWDRSSCKLRGQMGHNPLARRDDPQELIGELRGQRVALATASHGDELVLGFGERRDKRVGRISIPWAEWMLFTRDTPWAFETDEGVVATNRNRLNESRLRTLVAATDGATVVEARVRTKALGVGLELSNRSRLSLMPNRNGRGAAEVWALATPSGEIARALSSGEVNVVSEGSALPLPDVDETASHIAVEAEPRFATSGARRSEIPAATESGDLRPLLDALRQLVRTSQFHVYGPMLGPTSLADFVLVDPAGKVVMLQIKTPARRLQAQPHVPRIVVAADDLSKAEEAFIERESKSAVLSLNRVSPEGIMDLVSRLAG
ncbi:MAG: hypothetical protein M3217_09955 [Actinomycetota bacterium]|nr:hypothetical protein [Actinomycetota bacterium]